jgi:hypothetical protein
LFTPAMELAMNRRKADGSYLTLMQFVGRSAPCGRIRTRSTCRNPTDSQWCCGRTYATIRELIKFDTREQLHLVATSLKWVALGAVVGVLAGGASAGFLTSLNWATTTRLIIRGSCSCSRSPASRSGSRITTAAARGRGQQPDHRRDPRTEGLDPRRMAPLVYGGTVLTHLFGGSAGREGTAIQMSGSLTDGFSRLVRLRQPDRRMLLIAAIAGGFGAVFGVPLAGCVFALEVQAVGRMRYDALVPALSASITGDLVVRALGVHHTPAPPPRRHHADRAVDREGHARRARVRSHVGAVLGTDARHQARPRVVVALAAAPPASRRVARSSV